MLIGSAMMLPAGKAPTAEGTLAKTPFPHLLVYMADRALTGTVVLTTPRDGEPAAMNGICFREGAPSKVRVADAVHHLGRVLLELGLIDDDGLNASLATLAETKMLHGELLVRTGRIDKAGLVAGLRAQIVRKMSHLFTLPSETAFAFYQDANLLEDYGGTEMTPVEPLGLIWAAVRTRHDDPVVDALLGRLGATPLRLHEDSDIARFSLSPHEQAAIDLIRARPLTLSELLASEVAPPRTLRLLVYALLITRHLDHGTQALPVGVRSPRSASPSVALARVRLKSRAAAAAAAAASGPSSSRPPPSRSVLPVATLLNPEHLERRDEIVRRAESVDKEDYFTMLGVPRDASDEAVQSAYFALAKRWHTDRLPPDLADVKRDAAKVFARITEAFDTLSDAGRRSKYAELLKGGTGSPEEQQKIQKIIDATTDFQRAEVCFRKRDYVGAEKYVTRAFEADPEQGDYVALYCTLKAQARDASAPVEDLLQLLDGAVARNPKCERAFMARAQLYRRVGRREHAMSDYQRVVELNPRNVDATRELRLSEMRSGRVDGPPSNRPTPAAAPKPAPSSKPGAKPAAEKGKDSIFNMDLGKLFKR